MKAVELAKAYNPKDFEDRIYGEWKEKGEFAPKDGEGHFTVVMPPPNVTGVLHMGHALNNSLQDIIIRYKRMTGVPTLWVPGTDHAGIATQNVVERQLAKEGLRRQDLGREKFLERTWAVKDKHHNIIKSQLEKMGCSCDWDHERFTMDEGLSKAVREAFVTLYERGLIYKGKYLVNYCPKCGTALADDEVEYENVPGKIYEVRYPYSDGSGWITVATTRPETMFGDVAVAVNPEDERYKDIVGKTLSLPLTDREIPIIADSFVELGFGTGMVKITPAHDPNDWECGKRHNLEAINILNPDGSLNDNCPEKYRGIMAAEARKLVAEELKEKGYLVSEKDYNHEVGHCYRCHTIVEPYLSEQWFVRMRGMADKAIDAWKKGDIRFYPKRWENTYLHWMETIKDWCISRQLWWGHRIPAWYCEDCGATTVSKEDPCTCLNCGSKNIQQDPDTLDTWFSSALWPFSTLGWPEKTEDLKHYYPTNTLVTGYDIIGFWVSRMIFSGLAYTDDIPFDTVLIHGLVRDAQGRKMSKSLGNGIDPLEIIDQYGADALRFTLATGNSPGNDMRFSDDKVMASRNFANKLWNAARFVLMYLGEDYKYNGLPKDLLIEDKWIISKVNTLAKDVTDNLEKYELGIAVQKLYDFIWDVFCDWYIEIAKIRLQGDDEQAKENVKAVLVFVLTDILKLLHPFMPFITEEIYQAIPHDCESIMISQWPEFDKSLTFADDESDMEKIMTAIRAIRNRRSEMNIPPSKKATVYIETANVQLFEKGAMFVKRLASAGDVQVKDAFGDLGNVVTIITNDAKIYIPLGELVDFEAEKKRLQKELAAAEDKLAFIMKKLGNPGFVNKAPEKVVQQNRDDAAKLEEKIAMLNKSIKEIG